MWTKLVKKVFYTILSCEFLASEGSIGKICHAMKGILQRWASFLLAQVRQSLSMSHVFLVLEPTFTSERR